MSNAPAPTGEQLRVLGILKALQIDGRTSTRTLRPGRPYPPVRFDQVPRYVLDAELFRGPDEWGTPPVDVGAVLRELVIRGLVQEAAPDPCMIQQAEYQRPGGLVVFVSIEEHPDGSSWLRAGVSGGERFPRMRRFPMYTERLRPDPQAAPVPCYGITAAGLAVLTGATDKAAESEAGAAADWYPSRHYRTKYINSEQLRHAVQAGKIRTRRPGTDGNLSGQNLYCDADVRKLWPHKFEHSGPKGSLRNA